jgi:hypothetical protein
MKAFSIHGASAFQAFCILFYQGRRGLTDPGKGCVGLPGLKATCGCNPNTSTKAIATKRDNGRVKGRELEGWLGALTR